MRIVALRSRRNTRKRVDAGRRPSVAGCPGCGNDGPVQTRPEPSHSEVAREAAGSPALARLRALVEAHVPSDARERASKERFLVELDRLTRPFDRDADPVHVTASAVVAGARGTVLHRHRRLGRWLQPGGHVDPGESAAEAAVREVLEETGLEASHPAAGPSLVRLDVHAAATHVHLDLCFLLQVAGDRDPAPALGESPDVRWFSWGHAEEIADGALRGALRAAHAELERIGPS